MNQHQHQLKLWMVAPALLLTALPVQATPLAEAVTEAKSKDKLEISEQAAKISEKAANSLSFETELAAEAIADTTTSAIAPPQATLSNSADVDTPTAETTHFDNTTPEIEGLAQTQPAPLNPTRLPATPNPDALVPNPRITIDGNPVSQNLNPNSNVVIPNTQVDFNGIPSGVTPQIQPVAPAPSFVPRAVAPPLGDITISTVNTAPDLIDLGTAARVDSLILKDAPVREVLSFLARSAGLNVVYTDAAAAGGEGEAPVSDTVSLDLENESVQDAFNYVLMVSGLQANRRGRTIIVSSALPLSARNLVARSYRLNQVEAGSAATFLATQGASVQLLEQNRNEIINEETQQVVRVELEPPEIRSLTAEGGDSGSIALLLSGLAVSTDQRTNTLTMVGEPRQVEIATALLGQLDIRRRQVAVNVKVVDVNLLNQDNFNASFSFGIADSFFSVDGGALAGNYGQFRPATASETSSSLTGQPIINNPFAGSNTFLDLNSTTAIPGTSPGTIRVSPTGVQRLASPGALQFFNRTAGLSGDPFTTGFTDFTLAEDNIITVNADGTSTATAGTIGTAEAGLPDLFQFPRNFLAALQAQVVSGNAKILTDPTLVVQEGQSASVALTQQVFAGTEIQIQQVGQTAREVEVPVLQDAGLELVVAVSRIDDNGFISMSVDSSVSAPASTIATPVGQITLVQNREVGSGEIRMRDSQTLIIAGIIQEADRTTVSKVPILGDIPILGALFRSTNRTNERREVIVLVTPQILDDTARFGDWGYGYTPGQDAGQILQQQGIQVPRNR
ncbi:MAG: secretin and TonB N-terminal domain-containing protein [Jaaginema sp. PMC 1079.18]|nr:secretin and TonB N-terminal domain-containing protein [Jaaginema sp. PMC 1080.18]MEC4851112.1 secretin and TonB N-terminal domain-containing protein [Jaaginema sp. PMC 1079.18]MEC4867374.1 secretin and TonB N-terminal domain-containing protein [Jaaginema sp. PMC 1078.18]